MYNVIQWKRKGGITASAGTAITALLDPGSLRGRVVVTRMAVKAGATAQTLTVMQVLSKYRIAAAAASGQKVIKFAENDFAANDFVAIKMPSGIHQLFTVASVATKGDDDLYPVTLSANLPVELPLGAAVCFFGAPGDGHESVAIAASDVTQMQSDEGYFGANEMGEPLLMHLTNATNAATIEAINYPIIGV